MPPGKPDATWTDCPQAAPLVRITRQSSCIVLTWPAWGRSYAARFQQRSWWGTRSVLKYLKTAQRGHSRRARSRKECEDSDSWVRPPLRLAGHGSLLSCSGSAILVGPKAYELAMSLVENRRENGRICHEHVASLGSIETPPSDL
jgi:hypothetical protein